MLFQLNTFIRICFVAALLAFVSGCSDKSEITSGTGGSGVTSDGGADSSQFAGTYKGTVEVEISGGSIDDSTSIDEFTLVIRSDGTASLTIGGETIDGVIDGDTFGFSIRIVEEEDLVSCKGDARLVGRVSGSSVTGSISGSGECDLLTASTGVDLAGSLSGSKI